MALAFCKQPAAYSSAAGWLSLNKRSSSRTPASEAEREVGSIMPVPDEQAQNSRITDGDAWTRAVAARQTCECPGRGPGITIGGAENLGGADLGQKFVDRTAQHAGLIVEFAGVRQHVGCGLAGCRRRRGDAADMGADLA